jgi:hypothetical protein
VAGEHSFSQKNSNERIVCCTNRVSGKFPDLPSRLRLANSLLFANIVPATELLIDLSDQILQ